jgi:hypothetical protein
VPFGVLSDQPWLVVGPNSGQLPPGAPLTVTVNVDRPLPPGLNVGHLTVVSGTSQIQVTVEAIGQIGPRRGALIPATSA